MKDVILPGCLATEMPGFVRVDHLWTADEWRSAVLCRLGRFGAHSRVVPGLYALGRPGDTSPVLVTASYRLSFDLLRRDLRTQDCWILVLDTKGLGVGSASAAGTFGTDELVTRIAASRLSRGLSTASSSCCPVPAPASTPVSSRGPLGSTFVSARARASDLPRFLSAHDGVPLGPETRPGVWTPWPLHRWRSGDP